MVKPLIVRHVLYNLLNTLKWDLIKNKIISFKWNVNDIDKIKLKELTNTHIGEEIIMCGIIGYVGDDNATPILLHGLQKLEYRGYDSAGIAVREKTNIPTVVKAEGKLNNLISKVEGLNIIGTSGIGHSRWSTHGAVYYSLSESYIS